MSLSKSGYIKAVAVHMKTSLGRPMENAEEIVRQVKQYEAKNPDLIVFGELSISGYSCGDLFLQSFMEEQCRMAITYLCDNRRSQIHLLQLEPHLERTACCSIQR